MTSRKSIELYKNKMDTTCEMETFPLSKSKPASFDQRGDVSQGFPKEELLLVTSLLVGVPWYCLPPFLPPALLQRVHDEASFLFYETPCSPFTSTL